MTNKEIKHYKQMIVTLEKYGELFKGLPTTSINMGEGEIPTCKTPGCVGGYIALFNGVGDNNYGSSYYERGADIFAKEMGFKHRYDLGDFFADHPEIWGNRRGWYLFNFDSAYNEGGEEYEDGTLTLTVEGIINKLLGVAKRMEEELKRLEE